MGSLISKAVHLQSFGRSEETESSLQSFATERSSPHEEAAVTTDPVCGMKIEDNHPKFELQFAGKKYFFCSEDCRKEFEEQPEQYIDTAA